MQIEDCLRQMGMHDNLTEHDKKEIAKVIADVIIWKNGLIAHEPSGFNNFKRLNPENIESQKTYPSDNLRV